MPVGTGDGQYFDSEVNYQLADHLNNRNIFLPIMVQNKMNNQGPNGPGTYERGDGSEGTNLSPGTIFTKNASYVKQGLNGFNTELNSEEETGFKDWVKQHNIPFDVNSTEPQDYDMRGFYKALQAKDPRAVQTIDPNDNRKHFPDYWKTPFDLTFSNQSIYATPDAPAWKGNQLVDKYGNIVFDDVAQNTSLSSKVLSMAKDDVANLFTNLKNAVISGVTAPHDAYYNGMSEDEAIRRATDLAGLMVMGPAPIASKVAEGTLGSFAGVGAKTANKLDYSLATKMAERGFTPDEVHQATGWFQGIDGKWRFEVSDDAAKVLRAAKQEGSYKLYDVLHHPDLYEAYPDLKDMPVEVTSNMPFEGAVGAVNEGKLYLKPDTAYDPKSTILHEVQHLIQSKEEFNNGSNPAYRLQQVMDTIFNKAKQAYSEQGNSEQFNQYKDLYNTLANNMNKFSQSLYARTPGEVEARLTQYRKNMTPEERKAIPPEQFKRIYREFHDPDLVDLPLAEENKLPPSTAASIGDDREDLLLDISKWQREAFDKANKNSYGLGEVANDNGQLMSDIQQQYADMYQQMKKSNLKTVPDVNTATPLEAVTHYQSLLNKGNKQAAYKFEDDYKSTHGPDVWTQGIVEQLRQTANRPTTILEQDIFSLENALGAYARGDMTAEQVRQLMKEKEWTLGHSGLRKHRLGEVEVFDPMGHQHFLNF